MKEIYERSLIVRLINNDEDAFNELYLTYKSKLFYFTMKFVKSKEFAEDICHDVFIALWKNRHRLEADLSISGYLYKITRNRILNSLRNIDNETQLKTHILAQAVDYTEDTNNTICYNELVSALSTAINRLSKRQKEIFKMNRLKGMSYKEIAKSLGISVYTVQEHLSEAVKNVHTTLQKRYGIFSLLVFCSLSCC